MWHFLLIKTKTDHREIPLHSKNIDHSEFIEFNGRTTHCELKYLIQVNGESEFTRKNFHMKPYCIGNVIDDKRQGSANDQDHCIKRSLDFLFLVRFFFFDQIFFLDHDLDFFIYIFALESRVWIISYYRGVVIKIFLFWIMIILISMISYHIIDVFDPNPMINDLSRRPLINGTKLQIQKLLKSSKTVLSWDQ